MQIDKYLACFCFFKSFRLRLIQLVASRTTRAISLRSERSMSRGFPSLELDTVMEERSDDQTQVTETFLQIRQCLSRASLFQIDLMTPESPSDPMKPSDSSSS